MNVFGLHSGDKRKVDNMKKNVKMKKISTHDLSYSMDRMTIASEKVAAKIDYFIRPIVSNQRHGCRTYWRLVDRKNKSICTTRRAHSCPKKCNKEILDTQNDENEKLE